MFKINSFLKKHTIEVILGAILLIVLIIAIINNRRRVEKMSRYNNKTRRMGGMRGGYSRK